MKPTIEQLNALSDYEINCAAVEKLGLPAHRGNGNLTYKDGKSELKPFDYCNDPRHYMPIAIEHGITIEFAKLVINKEDVVLCSSSVTKHLSGVFARDKTGRAICTAFLLMNQEPV